MMKISNEAKVGVLVFTVLVALGIVTFRTGDFSLSKKGYTVKVHFENIDGVGLNAPVMLNGLEVGKVESITILEEAESTKLELLVWIEQGVQLREGTTAYVKNMGFLGEKYVGLAAGDNTSAYLTPGAIIPGRKPADFDALMLDGQEIAGNVKEITANLKERLDKNKELIDRIFVNLDSITENLDERLTKNENKIDTIFENLESSSVNLDQFTYDLKQHPWKLLYRPKEKRERSIRMMED